MRWVTTVVLVFFLVSQHPAYGWNQSDLDLEDLQVQLTIHMDQQFERLRRERRAYDIEPEAYSPPTSDKRAPLEPCAPGSAPRFDNGRCP